MAHRFEIRNIKPYDGDDPMTKRSELTALEWSWIKRFSGYMPTTLDDGLDGFDPSLVVTLAILAMVRDGKINRTDVPVAWERLSNVPFDSADDEVPTVRFVLDPDAIAAAEVDGETENPTT
jgi:hypothetical protein